ncbi:hypothetical protein [Streptomyces hirsutus]|uniref:hypothetical protein n=1 Tax=Streptomyces hirsutus TaxID=35620 RepID=UPI00369C2A5C
MIATQYAPWFAPSLRGLGHLRPQLPGLVGRFRFALVVLIGAVGGDGAVVRSSMRSELGGLSIGTPSVSEW